MYTEGVPLEEIAKKYNVSIKTIGRLRGDATRLPGNGPRLGNPYAPAISSAAMDAIHAASSPTASDAHIARKAGVSDATAKRYRDPPRTIGYNDIIKGEKFTITEKVVTESADRKIGLDLVYAYRKAGYTLRAIGEIIGVSRQAVHKMLIVGR